MNKNEILLIYDKQCPACNNYCQIVRIRESIGELILVDARENSDVLKEVTDLGLDIDQGMVLKMEEAIYYGSDAIHALALLSSRSGVFNRVNYWLFKSSTLSGIFYPVLRFFRNILLKFLGKTKINNLNVSGNNRF
ncbi:MAG: putative DCC family thiol-disulfide oxidoreductase YuxK [Candidatus Endobugula sp.]|jgi:predicted DCC family thiol-disulfide oxidoreductase YuxK